MKLSRLGVAEDVLLELEEEINSRIDNSIKLAKKAPLVQPDELYRDVVQ
jgi:TPP-dependent pyruvate/acetoin dehydrogenase alpha subunit